LQPDEEEITQMTVLSSRICSWRRAARLATFPIILGAVWAVGAQAQTPPYALFQYSTISGSSNTITATQLPVVNASGVTTYQNVTLLFDVDSLGNLTLAPGYPTVLTPPRPLVSGFKAGTYVGPPTVLGGKATIIVSGPSVGPSGGTAWTLVAAAGADPCTFPSAAVWYDVASLANNLLATRLKNAGITSTFSSYGTGGSQCNTDGNDWLQSSLLGFSQVGNTLTISSYTYEGIYDYGTPKDTIVYTKTN
jgi:hypothetical protein